MSTNNVDGHIKNLIWQQFTSDDLLPAVVSALYLPVNNDHSSSEWLYY